MMRISSRARNISPSATLSVDALAKSMIKAGHNVIGFGAGEPDFDTPQHIREAAVAALDRGYTRYTPAGGTLELKEAVCARIEEDYQVKYEPDQVIISCGAKHSLYNLFQVICDQGDEVILMAPYWVSYLEQIKLAGAVPVVVAPRDHTLKPSLEDIEAAITSRTRAIIVNSPSNPSGIVLDRDFLVAVGELALKHDLLVISDEIYDKLIYGTAKHVSFPTLGDELKARTVLINGVSKTYAMTGWRIGWAVGPVEIIKAMINLQSHSTSNPTSIAQYAAMVALTGPQAPVEQMRKEFSQRRDFMLEKLNQLPGVSCQMPEGAFYAFPNIGGLFGKSFNGTVIDSSETFAKYLLQEVKVAVVPGIAFGANEYVRLSYCLSMDKLAEGLERIHQFILKLT